jgi:hypothetical protein
MQLFSNIAMDPVAGNIYVTGSLQGTMTLPTASGTWTVTAVNQTGFVMGLDRNTGNLVWFAEYSPQVNSVAADGSGNLYIHSTITSAAAVPWTYLYGPGTGGNPIAVRPTASGDSEPAFIKCDSNGNILWSGNFSTQTTAFGDSSVTMTVDGTGNVYFGGRIRGTVDVDPGPGIKTLTSVFQSDAVIGKIDTNGNLVWVVHNTLTDNGCSDIVVDSNGNLDASFSYPYALSVTVTVTGKGSHKTTTTTVVGGNLVQFDNNGNLNWYQTNTNNVTAILLDPAGNFYLGMGPNQASELSKYNSAGNLIWSVPNYGYGIQNMVIDPAGDIWTCGAGNGQVDVSPTSSPVYLTWPNNQTWALMLVKWTQPGGLAAALPNGAGLGAFATVEGIGSGGNGDMKLKGHR